MFLRFFCFFFILSTQVFRFILSPVLFTLKLEFDQLLVNENLIDLKSFFFRNKSTTHSVQPVYHETEFGFFLFFSKINYMSIKSFGSRASFLCKAFGRYFSPNLCKCEWWMQEQFSFIRLSNCPKYTETAETFHCRNLFWGIVHNFTLPSFASFGQR